MTARSHFDVMLEALLEERARFMTIRLEDMPRLDEKPLFIRNAKTHPTSPKRGRKS